MMSESKKETPEFKKTTEPLFEKYRNSFTSASLLELNSELTQKLVREIYAAQEKAGLTASRVRNERICKNIRKSLLANTGKRILVIYGMDHKYFIDDFVSTISENEMIPVSEWFDVKKVNARLSKNIKDQTLLNLKSSGNLLKKRIEEKFYSKQWEPNLREKQKRFPLWVKAVQDL